jgi:hypothetical protein
MRAVNSGRLKISRATGVFKAFLSGDFQTARLPGGSIRFVLGEALPQKYFFLVREAD